MLSEVTPGQLTSNLPSLDQNLVAADFQSKRHTSRSKHNKHVRKVSNNKDATGNDTMTISDYSDGSDSSSSSSEDEDQ